MHGYGIGYGKDSGQCSLSWRRPQPANHDAAFGRDRDELAQDLGSLHLLPSLTRQDEEASACLFLVSEDVSFNTGHPLIFDGGWSVR